MRPSARTEQQIWAMSTDDERSVPNPQLKHTTAGTLKKCHDIDTWQGRMGAPSHSKRVEVIRAQGRDLDAFKGYPRKPLGLWVFSIFHPNTLSRGPRGQGLGPCTGFSPALLCALLHTQGQATPFPKKSSTMPGNSPQFLKLSTFFTNPLIEASMLDFWLVQIQSAGYKHTTQLSVTISRRPLQRLVPLRARLRNRSELCKCPPWALLLCPIYTTVQCRETQPFPNCTRRRLPPSSATQREKDTNAVLSLHIHAEASTS